MIPSIEEILAGLLAGNYTLAQSSEWIYRHQEMAAEAGDEKAVRLQLAAMAMQGLLSALKADTLDAHALASISHKVADAMLKATEAA